jgi:hypothetical protein
MSMCYAGSHFLWTMKEYACRTLSGFYPFAIIFDLLFKNNEVINHFT